MADARKTIYSKSYTSTAVSSPPAVRSTSAIQSMTIIFSDDFDTGFTDSNGLPARDPSKWLEWTDGTELLQDDGSWELDPEGQLGAGFASTVGYGLVFKGGSGAVRQTTTTSLSTITSEGVITFDMIFGDNTNGGEEPDRIGETSEGIYLSYSINGGNTYTDKKS